MKMSKSERIALARECRRKVEILRNQELLTMVSIQALERRRNEIDPDTEDPYEMQLALALTMHIDILEIQRSGTWGEAEKLEREARRLESDLQYENTERVRGL